MPKKKHAKKAPLKKSPIKKWVRHDDNLKTELTRTIVKNGVDAVLQMVRTIEAELLGPDHNDVEASDEEYDFDETE